MQHVIRKVYQKSVEILNKRIKEVKWSLSRNKDKQEHKINSIIESKNT
jgi:hypothetical protein